MFGRYTNLQPDFNKFRRSVLTACFRAVLFYVFLIFLVCCACALHADRAKLVPFVILESVFCPLALSSAPLLYGGFLKKYPGIKYSPLRILQERNAMHMLGVREDKEAARLYDSLPFSPFAPSAINHANMLYIYPAILTGFWIYSDSASLGLEATFPDLVPQRNLFIDAVLEEESAKQAVILGAGFDVRAYGKHGRRMKFFEVDFNVTQRAKLDSLAAAGMDASGVSFVPLDVRDEQWLQKLEKGLIYYLPKNKVTQLLDFVSECAQGSVVVFDYLHTQVVRGEKHSYMKKILEMAGEPLLFGRAVCIVSLNDFLFQDWASGLGFEVKRWQSLPTVGGMVALEVVQRRKATTRIEKGTKKGQQRDNEARSQIKVYHPMPEGL
ncbi:hypothetical protein GUITHDRAFT_161606 [Guillardia theta CCMP2712]|uniref:S-adenosyl-L-methionine-dependent methyltransferase n=1 Tax=Guillardia theta (strain CCMP2712) TaxID=905079 RepID=L1JSB7_GUITC|nr:hypothetical protein GUITHDRAFT_161606 [Guillardia theta CCMP2712]EKX51085.1 hypothetical protein GUITHDRAFT_161606 [Guillardia theta CCMP2712]|eukprot:XP_005838065.1 hypothetical protein GUITHDRAFT_161606 [Guillardia theta CCMP2712]